MDYTPLNRHEKYLNAIMNGDNDNLPKPENREEAYLYNIAMNSGGGGEDYSVKYTEQSLTSEQQAQVRENIGAGTSSFSGRYSDLTDAPPLVKGTGTGGNTIGGTGGTAMNSAKNLNSYAYGYLAGAYANYAFAFGDRAFAGNSNRNTGKHAVAIGNNVSAEKDYEFAYGKFNQSNADTVFSIGDGTSNSDKHNLMELKTDGTLLLNGNAVKTEGGDDNKLRLGQIEELTGGNGLSVDWKKGFGKIVSSTATSVVFTSNAPSSPPVVNANFHSFGDFIAYNTAEGTRVFPIAGRKSGKPTTGKWIYVESCELMFYSCGAITSLDLSMFDTTGVAIMQSMFTSCTALTALDLSAFDTSSVVNMKYMFDNCSSLKTLDLSSFDMTNVVEYTRMFGNSSNPAGITTLKCPKINPHDDIPLPRTLYSQDGTAYTKLPVTTGTSIELRQSWT